MLKTLNLARGAVAAKSPVIAMTHFYIDGDRIQGTDGKLTVDAYGPDTGVHAVVPGERFLKAIGGGDTKLVFVLTNDKLVIKKDRLRVTVQTLPLSAFPLVNDFGGDPVVFENGANLLQCLKTLAPFISTNPAQPWSNSILLRDGYAYATNNVLLLRVPFYTDCTVALPGFLVNEMLRNGEPPCGMLVSDGAISVIYNTCRMRAQKITEEWPGTLTAHVARFSDTSFPPIPPGLLAAVKTLKPFFPNPALPIVDFTPVGVATKEGIHSASIDLAGLPPSSYRYESLTAMLSVATHANFGAWPEPVPFKGDDGVEGFLCGMRQ